MKVILLAIILSVVSSAQTFPVTHSERHRVVILTDIEADPDDSQSLVRLLLYSNEIDIKGIVATTSVWKRTSISPETIKMIINAYGKVWANLCRHEADYPAAETLLRVVKNGLPLYGMKGVGEGMDSEGSEWIIKMLEEDDDRPLWVSVWGGVNTLAQALYKIRETRSEAEARDMISKLRVYTISDQDDSGIWIRNNFPDLFYIVSCGDEYSTATWTGIMNYVEGIDNECVSNKWLAENIQQGHGPLGAVYPDVAYGMEGDTPSFLSLIPNGLNDPGHPDKGGWGGRYEFYQPEYDSTIKGVSDVGIKPETRASWTNANDNYTPYIYNAYGRSVKKDTAHFNDNKVTIWRWREDFQNDFAARMDWCTKSFSEANHPPVPVLAHDEHLTVKSGEGFTLDASSSTDPDGDNLSYLWFNYPEAGTYKKMINIDSAENLKAVFVKAPVVKKEETVQFIVRVTDKGSPNLSRYKRIVVTITP